MKRGDIVVVRQKGVFTSKPRPAVVVQASALLNRNAVVVCLITSDLVTDPPFYRVDLRPTQANGLTKQSQIMADLPVPILLVNVTGTIGVLEEPVMGKLNTALALFLELA
jgi:mRNA interferase MazF